MNALTASVDSPLRIGEPREFRVQALEQSIERMYASKFLGAIVGDEEDRQRGDGARE